MILGLETVGAVTHTHTGISNEKCLYSNKLYIKSDECKSSAKRTAKIKEKATEYNCVRAIKNSSISSVNKKSIKMDKKVSIFMLFLCFIN